MNTAASFDIDTYMESLGREARVAGRAVARASTAQKNAALLAMADSIDQSRADILAANRQEMDAGRSRGLDAAVLGRMELATGRIDGMIAGLQQVAGLVDPIGEVTDMRSRPSGIQVGRMRVPLGVVGIIYESRPNVACE